MNDGVEHYQMGRYDRAAAAFASILKEVPTHADALHLLGLTAHKMGHPKDALRLMELALDQEPKRAAILANRSLPLRALGRLDDAIGTLQRALRYRSPFALAHLQLAEVYLQKQEGALAEAESRRALEIEPKLARASMCLGAALLEQGKVGEARALYESLAVEMPEDPDVHADLGRVLAEQGLWALAIQRYEKALELRPGWSRVISSLGTALYQAGEFDRARALLESCVDTPDVSEKVRPVLAQLYFDSGEQERAEGLWRVLVDENQCDRSAHLLAMLWMSRGDGEEALEYHWRAVTLRPNHGPWVIGLAECLTTTWPEESLAMPMLEACLAHPDVDPQSVEPLLRRCMLGTLRGFEEQGITEVLLEALGSSVGTTLLRRVIVRDERWERLFTHLRGWLRQPARAEAHTELLESLACQAFHTGFCWWETEDERVWLARSDDRRPEEGIQDAIRAMYRLPSLDHSAHLGEEIRRVAILKPGEEERLAAELPTMGVVKLKTSLAVQAQYEVHPYPRLINAHRKPAVPLARLVTQRFPRIRDSGLPREGAQVLVAGCGTGQQLLSVGTRYGGCDVTAFDLSRKSLGIAARKLRDWGLGDIELFQADLHNLAGWERRFHWIEAGGVLHHLKDPVAGFQILVDLLHPGGWMKVGLYSERSRADVVAAHALGAEQGWESTPTGIRHARKMVAELPQDHPCASLCRSPDFYSAGGFRDLAQHVMEHRFRPAQLSAILRELGMEFIGFQHPKSGVTREYAEQFPEDPLQVDLSNWDTFEETHPRTFAGMYQFWCRRKN